MWLSDSRSTSVGINRHQIANLIEGELEVREGILNGRVQIIELPPVMKSIQKASK